MSITFNGDFVQLSGGRKVYYVHSKPERETGVPIVAIHGLGGSSSFWIPALQASGLGSTRNLYAYDMDGHGLSDFSGRPLTADDYIADLKAVLEALALPKVVLLGHSMNGSVVSLFAEQYPTMVDQLVLLHPVRNLPDAAKENMRKRAEAASTVVGLSGIASTVAATAVAKATAASDPAATAFIRELVATTKPEAYAAACLALAAFPAVQAAKAPVPVHLIGGEEDYLAGPVAIEAWSSEAPNGTSVVLKNVGHWGAIEAPLKVGKAVAQAVAPTDYSILLSTFRHEYLYSLNFNTVTHKLELQHTNKAVGGHNWLDVSADGKTLYATGWGDIPTVSSYTIVPPTAGKEYYTTELQQTVKCKYLSGYVVANSKAMYSACGPQVDVFLLGDDGALLQQPAVQSFALVSEDDMHKGKAVLDFGGLRHGGHSADLSPDGTKLYVADIGRNCVWMYHVDTQTGLLTEASKNVATRPDDGPRHAWPHPNGKLVYSLQEHTSYVDVFRLSEDDQRLEFVHGSSILPPGDDKKKYWADEVRLSPDASVVFGSTRGLEPQTKGWITAWDLTPDGYLVTPDKATHRLETRTSGGWANAIAVCPNTGPRGEVFLTLTDSEVGFIQVIGYLRDEGFKVLDEVVIATKEETVGAAIAVWL